ncbi:hypothetical protein FKR81_22955 [Lentzea tibetensis]|uniref:Uncharacterized protein n=1 Tax=Lentzea tibetensis TaxID=2591470 RepID=A0A563ER07_9PSEU|nr:hypothetical protein [Lentzea tibetensis]TWP50083.1 hypothetical protein FKR81_22955 [Lentzea tibetensis]
MTFWWMWNPSAPRPAGRRFFRPSEASLAASAPPEQVVRSSDFTCPAQLRRATSIRADFLTVSGDPAQLAIVERRLWTLLVALRRSLPIRDALTAAGNRPGRAALVAEPSRELMELDRRLDRFGDALHVLATSPSPEQLRHTAALD